MEQTAEQSVSLGVRDGDNYILRQSWRNQAGLLALFFLLLGITTYLTILFPGFTTLPFFLGDNELSFPVLKLIS